MTTLRRLMSANVFLASLLLSLGLFSPAQTVVSTLDRLHDTHTSSSATAVRLGIVSRISNRSTAEDNPDDVVLFAGKSFNSAALTRWSAALHASADLPPRFSSSRPRAPPLA